MSRPIVPLAAMLGFALGALLYVFAGRVWGDQAFEAIGIAPFRHAFLDTGGILSAVRCLRAGLDIYATNPCDELGRVDDYSPLWLALRLFPVTPAWDVPAGFFIDLSFLLSLWLLPRVDNGISAAVMLLGVFSTPVIFGLQRGNNDLLIFALVAAGTALLATRSRVSGWGILFLAGALKYYPLCLFALALLREPRRRAVMICTAGGCAAFLLVALFHHAILRSIQNVPDGLFLDDRFGIRTLAGGLGLVLHLAPAAIATMTVLLIGFLIGLAVLLAPAPCVSRLLGSLDGSAAIFFQAGALMTLGCYFAAENWGYRAVNLLFVLPGLIRAHGASRLAPAMTVIVLCVMWSASWRHWAGAVWPGRIDAYLAAWLMREILWLALAALLLACLINPVARHARLYSRRNVPLAGNGA